jgi:hypothetical protein
VLSNDGRRVLLKLVFDDGIDFGWELDIPMARALSTDLAIVADEAEGVTQKH